jgi:hypothetical protein
MSDSNNTIAEIRNDVAALAAVQTAGLNVSDAVFSGVWRWFRDVELVVPLPVLVTDDEERASLALEITGEMDQVMARLEPLWAVAETDDERDTLASSADGVALDNLFRELAGVFANLVNEEVPVLPAMLKESLQENLLESLSDRFDLDEDEVRSRLKNDSRLRMIVRMSGLDPDAI